MGVEGGMRFACMQTTSPAADAEPDSSSVSAAVAIGSSAFQEEGTLRLWPSDTTSKAEDADAMASLDKAGSQPRDGVTTSKLAYTASQAHPIASSKHVGTNTKHVLIRLQLAKHRDTNTEQMLLR